MPMPSDAIALEDAPQSKLPADAIALDNAPNDDKHQSLKEMAQGEFDSVKDLTNLAGQGLLKTFTGKGVEDRLTEGVPSDTSKMGVPEMIATNAKRAALGTVGQAADMATSPLVLAGAVAPKISEGLSALKGLTTNVRNGISRTALTPDFAQTKADFKYGHDARNVLQTMPDVAGPDLNSTQEAVSNKMSETGQAIQSTMEEHPQAKTKLDIEDQVSKPFDDRIAQLNQQNPQLNAAAIKRLQAAKLGLLNRTDASGNIIGIEPLNKMTPKQIWEYRKAKIDPMTKFTGNASDDAVVNEAYQEARHNLRTTMNTVMPELKPLNKDYGDLNAADEALNRMAYRAQKEPAPPLNLKDIATLGMNKWMANPGNKIKMAQWLYRAPAEQVEVVKSVLPDFEEEVNQAFSGQSSLGFAGQAGSKAVSSEPVLAGGGAPGLQELTPKGTESTSPIPENFNPRGSAPASAAQYQQEQPFLADAWKRKGGTQIGNEGGAVNIDSNSKGIKVTHFTDADKPRISTKSDRLIPNSISFSPEGRGMNVWGKNKFSAIISPDAKVLELPKDWDLGGKFGDDATTSRKELGKAIYGSAKSAGYDVIKLNVQGETEYAVLNPKVLQYKNDKGIINIGDDPRKFGKAELQESLKHYENQASWAKGNNDRSQARDAETMVTKIKNALGDVGKSPLGLAAATGVGAAAALGAPKAEAMAARPKKVFEGQTFTGEASTYGWGEKGLNSTTADGDKFDSSKPFVAMSALPLGSTVEVKDLKTGKTITVDVKDFGPGKRTHRVVDLSKGAWQQLGYKKAGLAKVKVTVKSVGTGRRYNGKY